MSKKLYNIMMGGIFMTAGAVLTILEFYLAELFGLKIGGLNYLDFWRWLYMTYPWMIVLDIAMIAMMVIGVVELKKEKE